MQTIRTPENRKAFLAALREHGNVAEATRQAGVARNPLYLWKKEDPEFSAEWESALTAGGNPLNEEATEPVQGGWDEPIWYKGEQIGTVHVSFETALRHLRAAGFR